MQPMLQVSGTRHLQIKYQHRSNGQYLSIPDYDRAAEVDLNATANRNRHLGPSKRRAAQTQWQITRQAAQRLTKPLQYADNVKTRKDPKPEDDVSTPMPTLCKCWWTAEGGSWFYFCLSHRPHTNPEESFLLGSR